MCVFKNHAFIYFLRPPSWSGTVTKRTALRNNLNKVLLFLSFYCLLIFLIVIIYFYTVCNVLSYSRFCHLFSFLCNLLPSFGASFNHLILYLSHVSLYLVYLFVVLLRSAFTSSVLHEQIILQYCFTPAKIHNMYNNYDFNTNQSTVHVHWNFRNTVIIMLVIP